MKKIILLLALCLTAITTSAQRLLGGDISVLPNYEKDGTVYRDSSGRKVQFMDFVKTEGGWNAIRVRLLWTQRTLLSRQRKKVYARTSTILSRYVSR